MPMFNESNYDNIIEAEYEVLENAFFLRRFIPDMNDILKYKYARIAFIDYNPPMVLDTALSDYSNKAAPGNSITEWFKVIMPAEIYMICGVLDAWALAKYCGWTPERFMHAIKAVKNRPCPAADAVLACSWGMLLWHWQLENLLMMFIRNAHEAIRLRKDINARKEHALERIDGMKLYRDISLKQLLAERTLDGLTVYPNMKGALRVREYLAGCRW